MVMVTKVVEIATPVTFADVRARFTKPETMPYLSGVSDPIIALVLGELNVAIPSPDRNMPSMICHAGDSMLSRDRLNIPAAENIAPAAASHLVPKRSDSRPARGETIAMHSDPGIIRSAARLAS